MNMKKKLCLIIAVCLALGVFSGCTAGDNRISNAIVKTQDLPGSITQSTITVTSEVDFSTMPGITPEDSAAIRRFLEDPISVKITRACNADFTAGIAHYYFATTNDTSDKKPLSFQFYLLYDFVDEALMQLRVIVPVPDFLASARDLDRAGKSYFVIDFNSIPELQAMLPVIASLQKGHHILSTNVPFSRMLSFLRWAPMGSRRYALRLSDEEFKTAILQLINLGLDEQEALAIVKLYGGDLPLETQAKSKLYSMLGVPFQNALFDKEGISFEFVAVMNNPLFTKKNGLLQSEEIKFSLPLGEYTNVEEAQKLTFSILNSYTEYEITELPVAPVVGSTGLDISSQTLAQLPGVLQNVSNPNYTPDPITVVLDDKKVIFPMSERPELINNVVMVPAKFMFDKFGYDVTYNVLEGVGHFTAKRNNQTVELIMDNNIARIGGTEYILESPPTLFADRAMVPLKFICEAAGYDYSMTSAGGLITVTMKLK